MNRRTWMAVCIAATANLSVAWLGWRGNPFLINLEEWTLTAFFGLVAACLGFYAAAQGPGWRAWSIPPLAAFIATLAYTILGVIGGSFAERHVHLPMILIYTWFETFWALPAARSA